MSAKQQQVQQFEQQRVPMEQRQTGNMGGGTGAIRESRIKDRPVHDDGRDSSLKIKIELDLEVEVSDFFTFPQPLDLARW